MENKNFLSDIKEIVLGVVVSVTLMLIGLMPIGAAFMAATIIVLPPRNSSMILIISTALVSAIYYSVPFQIAVIIGFAIMAFISAIMFKIKLPNRTVLMFLCIFSVCSVCALNMLESHLTGTPLMDLILPDNAEILAEIGIKNSDAIAISSLVFSGIMIGAFQFIATRIMTIVVFTFKMSGTIILSLKHIYSPLRIIAPVFLWCLSPNFAIGVIVATLGIIAVNVIGIANASLITAALATAFLTPLCIQGICCILFMRKATPNKSLVYDFLTVAIVVFTFPISLILLGGFDLFTGFRSKRIRMRVVNIGDKHKDDTSSKKSASDDDVKGNDSDSDQIN